MLSRYTGAARELSDAVLVNPYDVDGFAEALHAALDMPVAEQRRRFARMRGVVEENTVYDWAGRMLKRLAQVADQPGNETEMTRLNLATLA